MKSNFINKFQMNLDATDSAASEPLVGNAPSAIKSVVPEKTFELSVRINEISEPIVKGIGKSPFRLVTYTDSTTKKMDKFIVNESLTNVVNKMKSHDGKEFVLKLKSVKKGDQWGNKNSGETGFYDSDRIVFVEIVAATEKTQMEKILEMGKLLGLEGTALALFAGTAMQNR